MTALGIDAGSDTTRDAEHVLRDVPTRLQAGDAEWEACTHFVAGNRPHVALSVSVEICRIFDLPDGLLDAGLGLALGTDRSGPADLTAGAATAADEHERRVQGRAVSFAGSHTLIGQVAVRDILAETAIDEVAVVGGGPIGDGSIVETRDFVRPEWRDGRLVLAVAPVAGGLLAPFEVPDPTPCCADHA
ncbi:MAG: hypothetical protein ACRDP2_12525 [Nocardioidaceae bacterium]